MDLNSILYKNEITLYQIYTLLAADDPSDPQFAQNAQSYLTAAREYFFGSFEWKNGIC